VEDFWQGLHPIGFDDRLVLAKHLSRNGFIIILLVDSLLRNLW